MSLGNLQSVSADKLFPCFGVIVSKPFRILAPQADYMRPQYASMICHFICDIINIDFIIRLRKQSVPAELFYARTLPVVTDQFFYAVDTVDVAFYECVKKFCRRISGFLFYIRILSLAVFSSAVYGRFRSAVFLRLRVFPYI